MEWSGVGGERAGVRGQGLLDALLRHDPRLFFRAR